MFGFLTTCLSHQSAQKVAFILNAISLCVVYAVLIVAQDRVNYQALYALAAIFVVLAAIFYAIAILLPGYVAPGVLRSAARVRDVFVRIFAFGIAFYWLTPLWHVGNDTFPLIMFICGAVYVFAQGVVIFTQIVQCQEGCDQFPLWRQKRREHQIASYCAFAILLIYNMNSIVISVIMLAVLIFTVLHARYLWQGYLKSYIASVTCST